MRIVAFIAVFGLFLCTLLPSVAGLNVCGIDINTTSSSKCKIVPCTSKAFACLDSPGEVWTCAMCDYSQNNGHTFHALAVPKGCSGVYADDQKHPLIIDIASKNAVLYAPKASWPLSDRRLYRRVSGSDMSRAINQALVGAAIGIAVCSAVATAALGGLLYVGATYFL